MDAITTAKLTDDVLNMVVNAKAHQRSGTQDNEVTMSDVVARLRERGWRNVAASGWGDGNLHDLLPKLGFKLVYRKAGTQVRTFVTM